jgi:hypothetical protein
MAPLAPKSAASKPQPELKHVDVSTDARCVPQSYITNGKGLYRVMRVEQADGADRVWVEDSVKGVLDEATGEMAYHQFWVAPDTLLGYKLVKAA